MYINIPGQDEGAYKNTRLQHNNMYISVHISIPGYNMTICLYTLCSYTRVYLNSLFLHKLFLVQAIKFTLSFRFYSNIKKRT